MDLKKTNAPVNTITYNKSKLEELQNLNKFRYNPKL